MKSFLQHLQEAVTPQEYQQGAENLEYSDPERAAYYASMAVSRGKQFAKLDKERARQTRIAEYGPGLKGILRSLFASRSSRCFNPFVHGDRRICIHKQREKLTRSARISPK